MLVKLFLAEIGKPIVFDKLREERIDIYFPDSRRNADMLKAIKKNFDMPEGWYLIRWRFIL